ncbi:hypothetical protein ACFL2V_16830 [Pseudomonadota bacterium]
MLFRSGKIALFSTLTAMSFVLNGCGGDGSNVGNNTRSGVQLDTTNTIPGGSSSTSLSVVGDPRVIDTESLGDVESAQSVVDSVGNVTSVWMQWDGTSHNLWGNRYTVGTGWGTAQKLESNSGDVSSIKIVVDSADNITVVWVQEVEGFYVIEGDNTTSPPIPPETFDVVRTDLWAKRLVAGNWLTGGLLETSDLATDAEMSDTTAKAVTATIAARDTEGVADIGEVELVVDSSNVVTAVWSQHNGTAYDLVAKRNVAGTWDASPTSLDTDPGTVSAPSLTLDGSELLVLWLQDDGANLNLWGSWYNAGWQAAATIDSENAGDVGEALAVIDGAGEATVTWIQDDGTRWNLWSARYAGAWAAAAKIETEDLGDVIDHKMVVDSTNSVTSVWAQSDGTTSNVWANRYSGAWGTAAKIEGDDAANAGSLELVIDTVNAITVVWVQGDGSVDNVWSNRFSGTWGTALKIETTDDGDVRSPALAVDSSNRVMAMWTQADSNRFDVWSNLYSSGSWGTAVLVEGLDEGSASDPHMIVDGNDRTVAVWVQAHGSVNHLLTNSYTIAGGWGTVGQAEPSTYNSGFNPQLLVDSLNIVTAVWLQPTIITSTNSSINLVDLLANRF